MPKSLSSIPDLVATLLTQPAPVFFLDTCSILDVPRSFYRELASKDVVPMAIRAVRAASDSPPRLHIVIPEGVDQEYARNLTEAQLDLKARIAHFGHIGRALSNVTNATHLQSGLAFIERDLLALTDDIYQSSLCIATDPACMVRGLQRKSAYIAPGTRGTSKDSDCIIIEHVLEVVRQLRASSFEPACIFVSSNHHDFGKAPNSKAPMDAEFMALSIDFMGDIATAMGQAKII